MGKLFFTSSSLIFLIFLSCVTKLATSQSPLVTTFCHTKIQDPEFCLKIFASDPRFQTAKTVHDLETLAIDLGAKFVKGISNKCSILLQRETDRNIKAVLGSCSGAYSLISIDFNSMRVAFQTARPLSELGAGARAAVLKCNQDFDDMNLASPLAQDNHDLLNFIQIIVGNSV
ncbi:hypothetical protein MTR67_045633 [Solanum verrucosum]|uniref:Pectinesterase inhibitor domain-containing protein n=1 Tax=Solanum verrucosum TaxID=315347 RepID=A0AAF0ZWD9_SOLVR|nr:hypothetical protein MTR67_045633 [Solanum verrucosum]